MRGLQAKLSLVMKLLSATIMKSAIVSDKASVLCHAVVTDEATICGEAVIGGNANISDNATVYGKVMPWYMAMLVLTRAQGLAIML